MRSGEGWGYCIGHENLHFNYLAFPTRTIALALAHAQTYTQSKDGSAIRLVCMHNISIYLKHKTRKSYTEYFSREMEGVNQVSQGVTQSIRPKYRAIIP
jgi:hypothetical protein